MKTFNFTLVVAVFLLNTGIISAHPGHDHGANGVPVTYPLKKCVVSDDPLGDHGKAIKMTFKGTDVYLCCKDCIKDFNKNPVKYIKMVMEAESKNR